MMKGLLRNVRKIFDATEDFFASPVTFPVQSVMEEVEH